MLGWYLVLSGVGIFSAVFSSVAPAQTSRAVTLELQCTSRPTAQQELSEVVVTLRNGSNTGTAVVLGTRLGNIYLASTLSIEARSGSNGLIQSFTFDNPTFSSNTTGREDPWIVPLPAHSSYALTINSNHFLAGTGERLDEITTLTDLQLKLTGRKIEPLNIDTLGLANWEVLITNMQSTAVAVPDDCN